MYSIGEISKIVNISVDALRYYDQIGLLKPCHIDEKSRYRYYSEEQVSDLLFILEMKEYGFSLDAIRELIISKDQTRIEAALKNRSQELKIEQDNTVKTIRNLNRRLNKLSGKENLNMRKDTILIVDDAAFMRHILGDILDKNGYTVVGEAATGEEAITKYNELRPDIVIMDIHMPGKFDGIQATEKIKEINRDATIIICSGRGQLANVLISLQYGAQAFVVKPFQAEYLLDSISDLLEHKWNPSVELVSEWLLDENLTSKLPDKPIAQESINRVLNICSSDTKNATADLLELLSEIG